MQGAGYGAGEVEWYEVRVPGLRVRRGAALVNSARVWVVIGLTSNAHTCTAREGSGQQDSIVFLAV